MSTQAIVPTIPAHELTQLSSLKVRQNILTTNVAGVTYEYRQEIIARMKEGDPVWLEQEPYNRHDPNAIRVCRNNGEKIGYLNRMLAYHLASRLVRSDFPIEGKVCRLCGRGWNVPILGVTITFSIPITQDNSQEE